MHFRPKAPKSTYVSESEDCPFLSSSICDAPNLSEGGSERVYPNDFEPIILINEANQTWIRLCEFVEGDSPCFLRQDITKEFLKSDERLLLIR